MSFKRFTSREVGETPVKIGDYDVPANTISTVIGLTVSNISDNAITCDVFHRDSGSDDTYVVKNIPIPYGSTAVLIGGSQKVVMEPGDSLFVEVSEDNSADVILSLLEVEE